MPKWPNPQIVFSSFRFFVFSFFSKMKTFEKGKWPNGQIPKTRAGRFYFFTHFYSLLLTSQFRIDQKRSTKNTHRSKTISPNLNRSKTINPNLNRSKTIRPKIGEEENEQKRATNKDFKECLQK